MVPLPSEQDDESHDEPYEDDMGDVDDEVHGADDDGLDHDEPGDAGLAQNDAYAPTDAPSEAALAAGFTSGPVGKEVSFKIAALLLFGPIGLLTLGSLVAPSIFWDRFVDPYYWTPIKQDLGFNLVNTATWAVLLVILLYWLDRAVRRVEQPMTFGVILAVVPYIVGGSIVRVFEDTKLMTEPLRYFFITPIIYVVITIVAVCWLVVGYALRKHSEEVGHEKALIALGAFFGAIVIAFLGWGLGSDDLRIFTELGPSFVYKATAMLALCFAVPYYAFWRYTMDKGRFEQVPVMGVFGTAFFLFALYLMVAWLSGDRWGPKAAAEPVVWIYGAMIVAPALVTGLTMTVARQLLPKFSNAVVYLVPVNLLLVFSQSMDGIMTAIGIDNFGYQEKHVLPDALIQMAARSGIDIVAQYPTFFVFLPLKIVVSLLVIWAIDIWAKEDMERYPNLVMLAKMAIIIVGLAPGARNSVRLAMQV